MTFLISEAQKGAVYLWQGWRLKKNVPTVKINLQPFFFNSTIDTCLSAPYISEKGMKKNG
jgi:hypothetical protein